MKTVSAVSLLFLFSVTSCDRIGGLFGHGDSSGGASSSGTSAPAATTAPADVLAGFEGEIDLMAKDKTRPAPVSLSLLVKNDVVHVDAPADLLSSPDVAK